MSPDTYTTRRLAFLAAIIAVILIAVGGTLAAILYDSAFERAHHHLQQLAGSQARLIEAVGRFDARFSSDAVPGGARAATLRQLADAHRLRNRFGDTGEFAFGQIEDGHITFLLGDRAGDPIDPVPLASTRAEPMRRALTGGAGTVIGPDYRGVEVLAAHDRVPSLGLGIVAKMDVAEVRAPLLHGVLLAGGFGLVLLLAGAVLFVRTGDRLIRHIDASRRRYRALFEGSHDGEFVLDGERIEEINERGCEMFGRPREEIVGRSPVEMAPERQPDGRPSADVASERIEAALDGKPQFFRWRATRGDGEKIDAEVSLNAVHTGEENRLLASVRDITPRVEREALRQRLMAIIEATPDAVGMADADGRILYGNPAARRLLGLGEEDLGDLTIADITAEATAEEHLRVAARDGVWQGETSWKTADGQVIPVSEVIVAHRDEHGELEYFSTIGRDIRERKRAEMERRRLVAAVDQASEGVMITSAEGEIRYVNPAFERITGYSRDDVLGRNPRILNSGHHDEEFYADLWETILAGEVWEGEVVNRRKDGTLYEEEMTISPMVDADGKVVNFVAVKRDVSDKRLLEAQLRQAQKMEAVGRLAGGVAHDFNNMLTGISGFTNLVLSEVEDEAVREDLRRVSELADRAAELTHQLLAFSRRQQLERQSLCLDDVVRSTLKMLGRLIGEDIELEFVPAAEPAHILADQGQLVQVLMNLVMNARDAMPDGGELTVETGTVELDEEYARIHADAAPGPHVLLTITDQGVGMDPTTLERIFEPFFTTKEAGEGTGLGLATVHGIVRQHDGFINVYSEPGRGTTFRVYFPRHDDGRDDAETIEAEPAPALHGRTILVVEDEEAVHDLMVRTLEERGAEVLGAPRPAEARRLLEGRHADLDLLVTDVIMPGSTGKELYDELAGRRPGLRVLFVSGYPARGVASIGDLDEGAPLLTKPFTIAQFLRRVEAALDGSEEAPAATS